MTISVVLAVTFIVITIVVASLVSYRVELTRAKGGKIMAFVALFLLPDVGKLGRL